MALSIFLPIVARTEIALLFVIAGIIGILLYHPPKNWKKSGHVVSALLNQPMVAGLSVTMPVLLALGGFFVKAGAFTFGIGLAIVPFLHQGVVLQHHWLNERQFLDAVAVGIITPGPVVITAALVGYLVAGSNGALTAAAGVFLPVYLFVLFVGRYIVRYRENPYSRSSSRGPLRRLRAPLPGRRSFWRKVRSSTFPRQSSAS